MVNIPKKLEHLSNLQMALLGAIEGDVYLSYEVADVEATSSTLTTSVANLNHLSEILSLGGLKEMQVSNIAESDFILIKDRSKYIWARIKQKKSIITSFQSTFDLLRDVDFDSIENEFKATLKNDDWDDFTFDLDDGDLLPENPHHLTNPPLIKLSTSSTKNTIPPIKFISEGGFSQPKNDPRFSGNVFTGEIHLFSVADLLEFFRSGQKTGRLYFKSDVEIISLSLKQGRICCAEAQHKDSIVDLLIQYGNVNKDDIVKYSQPNHSIKLCDFELVEQLINSGLIGRESLRAIMEKHIKMIIKSLIRWEQGRFAFHPDETMRTHIRDFSLDSQMLLLDAFRELDEESRDDIQ